MVGLTPKRWVIESISIGDIRDPRLSAQIIIGPLFEEIVSGGGPIIEDVLYDTVTTRFNEALLSRKIFRYIEYFVKSNFPSIEFCFKISFFICKLYN